MTERIPESPPPGAPKPERGLEVKALIERERAGEPFLVLRPPEGTLLLITLGKGQHLSLGRDERCAVAVTWDAHVSRTHADLVSTGAEWTIGDDGLSRNGTFVNGERVNGRRRLCDRDVLRIGRTTILFRDPGDAGSRGGTTRVVTREAIAANAITPAQRRVLESLCRPMAANPHAGPASNTEIAEELVLSIASVKTHIRALFVQLGIEDLPQSRKRARLAQVAFDSGLVSSRDLLRAGE